MNFSLKYLFVAVLAVVAGSIYLVSRDSGSPVVAAASATAPVEVAAASAAAPQAQVASQTAAGEGAAVSAAAGEMQVPAITSEKERADTLAARKSALPVFLKAADESIATAKTELETARTRGLPAEDIVAMETKLRTMQRVREQVLARNSDISG